MRRLSHVFATVAACVSAVAIAVPAYASTPASQSVSPSTQSGGRVVVEWTGTIPPGADSDSDCTAAASESLTDHHAIDLAIPAGFYDTHTLTAQVMLTPDAPTGDVVLTVKRPDGSHTNADNGFVGTAEAVSLAGPAAGSYDAVGCAFAGGPIPYHGKLVLTTDPQTGTPGGFGGPGITPPGYRDYHSPKGLADDAGEPSIGVNWNSDNGGNGGTVMFKAVLETDRVVFDDSVTPAKATWTDVTSPVEKLNTLDPILDTDSVNGRTFDSQLSGPTSLLAYSDDDGASWTQSPQGGGPSGVDHQTVGQGPYPTGSLAGPLTSYPNAVYYCSQYLAGAFCSRSDDGGLTFVGPFNVFHGDCGGLHGHVRVGQDGVAYLPNKSCAGRQGFAVSTNAGQNWVTRTVPSSTPGDSDPSVDAGTDGTAYFGYVDGDGHAKIAVTRDRGADFTTPVDVGAAFGIKNAVFPEVVAGDGDRAAFGFLGTPTGGDPQAADFGDKDGDGVYEGGEWHLYIATTYDRGRTWTTVDATPKDAVQRGPICLEGVSCTGDDRNLLDFNDITVDKYGRVLFAYADGCTGACVDSTKVADNPHDSNGVVVRQTTGMGLFATTPS